MATTPLTDAAALAEAEAALHRLKIGQMASELEVDGRKVRYSRTDIDKLEGYVADLKLRLCGGPRRAGAIGFV